MESKNKQFKLKQRLLDFAYNFKEITKKQKWVPRYDLETDSLSYTVKNIPDNSRIRYVTSDLAFYLTPDLDIKGVFIEYFIKNFVSHNKELEFLRNRIETKRKREEDIILLGKREMQKSNETLEKLLRYYIANNIEFGKQINY
jgi:hypothetical protein